VSYQVLYKSVKDIPFHTFAEKFRTTLEHIFSEQQNLKDTSIKRGVPGLVMRDILECKPLSVFIPDEYGGRGIKVDECLKVLEHSSYHSLPLSLMIGINGALFLQPLALYGNDEIKRKVYADFLNNGNMGGLMITEPDYGSDALHMQTFYEDTPHGYRIRGTKHWAGLTGWADYWLLTARKRNENGDLARDIDFFVHKKDDNGIKVEEVFNNLGLYMLPYGRNKINTEVGTNSRLEPRTTGVTMMLDILHRSRFQFPGMGIGFIKRMLDEALEHCKNRTVGGLNLINYDQVMERISRIQSFFTTCSAMCAFTSENAGMDKDLSREDVSANTIKTTVTDYMQEAAQSLLQLVGAKGYKLDHIAGKSIVDSRPFQIFEGSNDILYQQISESVIKAMRRAKITNLHEFLSTYKLSEQSADRIKELVNFDISYTTSQRKLVELGKAISRIISMEFVIKLGETGFRSDLIQNAITHLTQETKVLLSSYFGKSDLQVVMNYYDDSDWRDYLKG
jgi:alkylation response protein AidB-like acyl-CoA dehydrogenase